MFTSTSARCRRSPSTSFGLAKRFQELRLRRLGGSDFGDYDAGGAIGQASRLDGITPAALVLLAAFVRRGHVSKAACDG